MYCNFRKLVKSNLILMVEFFHSKMKGEFCNYYYVCYLGMFKLLVFFDCFNDASEIIPMFKCWLLLVIKF